MTFAAIFVPAELADAVSDRAWLAALIESERALANAQSLAGILPAHIAAGIAGACRVDVVDADRLSAEGRAAGNPVEPLVRHLREAAGDAGDRVHWGATSQDIMDSAAMLVSKRALGRVIASLDDLAAGLAGLAARHRTTPMAGRTLLQQAVPITFGLKAAGWLVAVVDCRGRLHDLRLHRLAAQLGGAAGTLAQLGDAGPEVVRLYAKELDLAEPAAPWHADRTRIAELGAALSVTAGALEKIARDLALLAQTEVGEASEPPGGVSSTMPQKQNPVRSTVAVACARQAVGHASVLLGGGGREHERGVGGWHAEWDALSGALAMTGAAAANLAEAVDGLRVDTERMRRNLDAGGGAVMAEAAAGLLAERIGRKAAQEVVSEAAKRAVASGTTLRDELAAASVEGVGPDELDQALDPDRYLGSAPAFVDRALAVYEGERQR
jgi:3-carboxy-cis,cis-muconate cycloisomerase